MISWMSKRTDEITSRHGMSVIGFDRAREAEKAWCTVGLNGMAEVVELGNVEGLTDEQIDRRFVASLLKFAISAAESGDNEGYEVLDELLDGLSRKE